MLRANTVSLLCLLLTTPVWGQSATNDLYVASFATGHLIRLDGSTGAAVFDVPLSTSLINVVRPGNGALYVSTHVASTVLRVDPETGANLGIFASGGGLATASGLVFGPDGNLYVGSQANSSVLRYDGSTGSFIDVFVPTGSGGLLSTEGVLFGPDGNLYVTEFAGSRVLRYDGDTGAFLGVFATDPALVWTRSMVFGPDGNLYVAGNNSNNVVRFDGSTGVFIDVFASGISGANGLAFGPDGNLYVAAEFAGRISRFDGVTGMFLGDFGPAGFQPIGLLFDVRMIDTVAGGGAASPSFCGDGGPATGACFYYPIGMAVDASDNLFIADDFNHRIRRVDALTGTITTAAGSATQGFCGDGGPAASACLNQPIAVTVDASGNLFIADYGNNRIRKVAVSGTITTVAGNGTAAFCGDGGPATSACLNGPTAMKLDANGDLLITDYGNQRIRRVEATTGAITTVAGNGTAMFCGDGGPATAACLNGPVELTLDLNGNLLVADRYNHRIRRIDAATGTITTAVGNGTGSFCGDGGPATSACLNTPSDVLVDDSGNLSIADRGNHRIRRVNAATAIITTIAGGGEPTPGLCGDGGSATRACLFNPTGVALDQISGRLLIGDTDNHRVRSLP